MNDEKQHPRSLSNLNDILSCLSLRQAEEAELSNSLSELLSSQEPIIASLNRLQGLLAQLDGLVVDATVLSDEVSITAETAQRVGGRVKSLDEEMRRVRESSERVEQVIELKVILERNQDVFIYSFVFGTGISGGTPGIYSH
jgi:conserved oligomeric Golgi complex subunit 4